MNFFFQKMENDLKYKADMEKEFHEFMNIQSDMKCLLDTTRRTHNRSDGKTFFDKEQLVIF